MKNESSYNEKIPNFIDRCLLKEWMTLAQIEREVFKVEECTLATILRKRIEAGRKFKVMNRENNRGTFTAFYLVKDFLFRTLAEGYCVIHPTTQLAEKLTLDIEKMKQHVSVLRAQIEIMESKKTDLKFKIEKFEKSILVKTIMYDLGVPFACLEEIWAGRQKWTPKCGVYFLFKEDKVVYVGQSINVAARISQHSGSKDFDSFSVLLCDQSKLDLLEGLYIRLLKPELNFSSAGRLVAPSFEYNFLPKLADLLGLCGEAA